MQTLLFAVEKLGDGIGTLLCVLYTELRGNIAYAFEERLFYLTTSLELYIEIYNLLEDNNCTVNELRDAIYYHFFDYADITAADKNTFPYRPWNVICHRYYYGKRPFYTCISLSFWRIHF